MAAAALVAGPGLTLLYETGTWSFGPGGTLWPVGFVVLASMAGLVTGWRIVRRFSRWLGTLVMVPNALMLLFYGFLLLFFGLGGSR